MQLSLAIVAGIMYGLASTSCGYGWGPALTGCMMTGLVCGVVAGDPGTGIALGAAVQSIYLGLISPGGNVPADARLSASVACPIALMSGLDFDTAVTLAVPVGLLGALFTVVKYIINGFFVDPAEACAEKADTRGVWVYAFLVPFIIRFLLGFVVVFAAVFFGVDAVQAFLNAIPEWVQHGLSVAGGILPTMGFGLTIMIIGQPKFIPLFLIGFFMIQYGGGSLTVMAVAIFATCMALFVMFITNDLRDEIKEATASDDDWDDDFEEETSNGESKQILTQGDINYFVARWICFCEVPHSYTRMQAVALCSAMAPILEKLYPGEENKEKLASALHREMMYFNTEGIWGSSVLGVAIAMEEEQAITQAMTEEEATASINAFKVGFMGPFAGVGDTMDWATWQYLLIGIGLPWALEGNPAGVLPQAIGMPLVWTVEGLFFTTTGYRLGRTAIGDMFTSGLIDRLIDTSCMVGMMMMGALGNSYVKISLANETAQATLDSIVPGLLPLLGIFAVYFVLVKVTSQMPYITIGIILIGLVGSLIGLL